MPSKTDEIIIKTAKEIVVKFIEVGVISPSSFHEHFKNIYTTVEKTVRGEISAPGDGDKNT